MFKLLFFESDKSCCSQDGKDRDLLAPEKKKTFLWAKKTIPMDVGVPTFGFELPNLSFAEKRCWDGGCSPGYDADTRVFKPKLCEAE